MSTPSTAVDVNAFYVTKATQQQYSLTTISDLKPVANKLVFGGPPECETRPLCLGNTEQQLYGLQFKEVKKLDTGGPITVKALKDGDIQVGLLFTGSSVIDPDFVMLQDDKGLQPADNAIAVWRAKRRQSRAQGRDRRGEREAHDRGVQQAQRLQVGDQKLDPKDAASQWLKDQGLS